MTLEVAAANLADLVRKFTSLKEGWTTIEERAQLYRDMVYALREYDKLKGTDNAKN